MGKTFTLGQLFTSEEIEKAHGILTLLGHGTPATDRIEQEIVLPVMARIQAVTGQENDSKYLAYVVLHALTYPQ